MGRPGSPCQEMGRPGGARAAAAAAAAQDGGAATGPGDGGAGRGWWEWAGRRGWPGSWAPQPSPCWPHAPRARPPAHRRRAAAGAGSRTSRAGRGRWRRPLGPAERGRHLLRDHQADPRPGAQVFSLPPLLPGGPGAGLGQGVPRPRARPRPSDPLVPPRLVPRFLQHASHWRAPRAGTPSSSSFPARLTPGAILPHPQAHAGFLSDATLRSQRLFPHTVPTFTHENPLHTPSPYSSLHFSSQPLRSACVFPGLLVSPSPPVPDASRTGSG